MLRITPNNKLFPPQLREIAGPPKELFISGNFTEDTWQQPIVGIVGSRKVTSYGQAVTAKFAKELAARGVIIVSGLALGVDSIAHKAALVAGGTTIAVLPSGLDTVYPNSHYGLAREIVAKKGLLMSEYTPKSRAFKSSFIARNRLVSGLASALLITEASERSGSLHTANFALEQGKEVLAVPGPITSDTSAGCNNLIKRCMHL
jgi:DNA processing protein